MNKLGTYHVRMVSPNNKLVFEVYQAASKAEATKLGKADYPENAHLETVTKVMSEGEANKAAAAKEAAKLKAQKEAMDKLEKERAKSKAKKDAEKKDK